MYIYIYTRIHLNITWTSMHTSPHPFGPLKYQKPNAERPKDQKLPASFASSERFDAFSPGTGCGRHHSWAWLVNTSYITIAAIAICLNHFIHHRIWFKSLQKKGHMIVDDDRGWVQDWPKLSGCWKILCRHKGHWCIDLSHVTSCRLNLLQQLGTWGGAS